MQYIKNTAHFRRNRQLSLEKKIVTNRAERGEGDCFRKIVSHLLYEYLLFLFVVQNVVIFSSWNLGIYAHFRIHTSDQDAHFESFKRIYDVVALSFMCTCRQLGVARLQRLFQRGRVQPQR